MEKGMGKEKKKGSEVGEGVKRKLEEELEVPRKAACRSKKEIVPNEGLSNSQ